MFKKEKIMTLENAKKALENLMRENYAYHHAIGLISYDAVTSAPSEAARAREIPLELFSTKQYKLMTSKRTAALLDFLEEHQTELDKRTARCVYLLQKDRKETEKIPMKENVAYSLLLNDADAAWHEAKEKSNFSIFLPYLERIFATCKRFSGYIDPNKDPYEVWLDKFEGGLTREKCDAFFAYLRRELVPLIRRVQQAKQPEDAFLRQCYPKEGQRELSEYLMSLIGIDETHCTLRETEHPFTTDFTKLDVRITTHYYENAPLSALYSTVHEGGHALYELHTDDAYLATPVGTGVSMAVHESQSRFYENILGRSLPFCRRILPEMKRIFPQQLKNVTADMLWRAVNKSEPSLIRTEADELTYPLHIMIRYELEKAIFDGKLEVRDLPDAWNRLYREYLGVTPDCDRNGVLQDSHWSGGSIGYFPSYALGSAYGAQLLRRMKETVDVNNCIEQGNFTPINSWLCDRIWQYGSLRDPVETFERAAGEPLDPSVYISYLTEKYTEVYDL